MSCVLVHAKSLQSCLTLCDPMDCSPPGSSVHGILQARILGWVACPPLGDLSNLGMEPSSLMSSELAGRFFTTSACSMLNTITHLLSKIILWSGEREQGCMKICRNVETYSIFTHFCWVLQSSNPLQGYLSQCSSVETRKRKSTPLAEIRQTPNIFPKYFLKASHPFEEG